MCFSIYELEVEEFWIMIFETSSAVTFFDSLL